MKIYNHHRKCVGEFFELSDNTYRIKFNNKTHYQDDIIESKEELEYFLEVRGLLKESDLGQLNIFDI